MRGTYGALEQHRRWKPVHKRRPDHHFNASRVCPVYRFHLFAKELNRGEGQTSANVKSLPAYMQKLQMGGGGNQSSSETQIQKASNGNDCALLYDCLSAKPLTY